MSEWFEACSATDVDDEDLICWDHDGHTYAIYNTKKGYFATDGMCTHEHQSLEEGMVIDCVVKCPLHGGRFDICSGKALSAPVTIDLKTYPVKVQDGKIFIQLGS